MGSSCSVARAPPDLPSVATSETLNPRSVALVETAATPEVVRTKISTQASPVVGEVARLAALAKGDHVYVFKEICISEGFYAYTSLGRHKERIRRLLAQDSKLTQKAGDQSHFDRVVVAIVQKAYNLPTADDARSQNDLMCNRRIVSTVSSLW